MLSVSTKLYTLNVTRNSILVRRISKIYRLSKFHFFKMTSNPDDYDGSLLIEGYEEGLEEYAGQDSYISSASDISLIATFAAHTTKDKKEKREKSSSDTISTKVPSFRSSSFLKSTYSPVSWRLNDSESDIYLQTSSGGLVDRLSEPLSSELQLPTEVHHIDISPPIQMKVERIRKKKSIIASRLTKPLCTKMVFLTEILESVVCQTARHHNIYFSETLMISFDKQKAFSDFRESSSGVSLPSDDFAGDMTFNTEEMCSGIYVKKYGSFQEGDLTNGFDSFSRITVDFQLIEEKKTEFQYNSYTKKEKSLHAFIDSDTYVTYRTEKCNGEEKKFRGRIKLGNESNFILDGYMCTLLRALVVVRYVGCFQCYSITITGRICRHVVNIEESKLVPVNESLMELILVRKSSYDYKTNKKFEMSESFYLPTGGIAYHTWAHSSYILHMHPLLLDSKKKLEHCMELTWKSDCILYSMFKFEKEASHCLLQKYVDSYPEIIELLNDFIISLFYEKPPSVYKFACDFFSNV